MTDNEKLARWQGLCSYRCVVDGLDCGECVIDDPDHIISDCDVAPTISSKLECKYWVLSTTETSDYLNDDAAAMSLLDTLVKKGYAVAIASRSHKWDIGIARNDCNLDYCISTVKPTRREAVVAACLELIEKEANNASS